MNLFKKLFAKKEEEVYYEKKLVPLSAINAFEKSKEYKEVAERKKLEKELKEKEKYTKDYADYLTKAKKVVWEKIESSIKEGKYSFEFTLTRRKGTIDEEKRLIKNIIIDEMNELGYYCELDIESRRYSCYIGTQANFDILGSPCFEFYEIKIIWNNNQKNNRPKFEDLDLKHKAEKESSTFRSKRTRHYDEETRIEIPYDLRMKDRDEYVCSVKRLYVYYFEKTYKVAGERYAL